MAQEPAAFLHVLVVDANISTRADTTQQLKTCNYKVTSVALLDEQLSQLQKTASSGHEAAELPRVDVALVEHAPPEGSAQPVIQHLLRSSLNVPIIVTSLLDNRQGVLECLYWGADDYLIRPLRLNELGNIWVHLWRRVHPPPGLVPGKPQAQVPPALSSRPALQGQDGGGHRPGEVGNLVSNEGSNPSFGEAARMSEPDSQLPSLTRESLPWSGVRSADGPCEKPVPVQSESQQPRNGPGSSQQLVASDHGSNQPTEIHEARAAWEEREGGPGRATLTFDAGCHGQQAAAGPGQLDGVQQGFRAWMPPSSQVQQLPSRKRSGPGGRPGVVPPALGDGNEGSLGDANELMQSNSMSAMHRPGGPALHSRTKQCVRLGQDSTSHASPSWDRSFPSYTELARQQAQKQSGHRAIPPSHDIPDPSGTSRKMARATFAQPTASRDAPANLEDWRDSSHLQAFAAGMAAASATMGSHPLSQQNFANPPWMPSAANSSQQPNVSNSHCAHEAPQEQGDVSARHQHDMQQFSFHPHHMLESPGHDHHRATLAHHRVLPHATPPAGPGGSIQRPGSVRQPLDYHAWEQAQRDQEEYDYLHSLWQQHFKHDSRSVSEQHGQHASLQHQHRPPYRLREDSGHCREGYSRDERSRGSQDAMLWQALQIHQQQQQAQRQQQCRADESQRPPSSPCPRHGQEPKAAQGLALVPQFPWPGMDAASPEAQAFVAAYASYFSQAAGSAMMSPPGAQAAGQVQRKMDESAGQGNGPSQPGAVRMWDSRASSGHASGSYCSMPGAPDASEPLQHGCRRSSLSTKDTFSRPAGVSQAGGHSRAWEGCRPPRPASVEPGANGHRRSLDSHRPGNGSKDPSTWPSSSSQSFPKSSAGPLITSPSPNLVTDGPAQAGSAQAGTGSTEPTSRERRAAALEKYKQKRKNLCHTRKIRYEMRKQLAQARPRVRGQFVKTNPQRDASNTMPVSTSPAAASSLVTQVSMDPSQGEDALSDVEESEDGEDDDSDDDAHQDMLGAQQQSPGPSQAAPPGPPLATMQALMSAGIAAFPQHQHAVASSAGTGYTLPPGSNASNEAPHA